MWAVATALEVEGEPGHRLDRTARVRARDGGAVGRRGCRSFARYWIYIVQAVARGRHGRVVRWVAKRPGEWHGLRQQGEAGEQERGWSQEWRRWRASPAVHSACYLHKAASMLLGSMACGGMGLDDLDGWMTCPTTTRCRGQGRCCVATKLLRGRWGRLVLVLEVIDDDDDDDDDDGGREEPEPEQS